MMFRTFKLCRVILATLFVLCSYNIANGQGSGFWFYSNAYTQGTVVIGWAETGYNYMPGCVYVSATLTTSQFSAYDSAYDCELASPLARVDLNAPFEPCVDEFVILESQHTANNSEYAYVQRSVEISCPSPYVQNLSPSSAYQTESGEITLTGQYFYEPVSFYVENPFTCGAVFGPITASSPTQITVPFFIGEFASPGACSLSVSARGGYSLPVTFSVKALDPVIYFLSPDVIAANTSGQLQVVGNNFSAGSTVGVQPPNCFTNYNASRQDTGTINISYTTPQSSTNYSCQITVTRNGITSNPLTLTVQGQ